MIPTLLRSLTQRFAEGNEGGLHFRLVFEQHLVPAGQREYALEREMEPLVLRSGDFVLLAGEHQYGHGEAGRGGSKIFEVTIRPVIN